MSEAPPLTAAREWLEAWTKIGGGVTIAASGNLSVWRITPAEDMTDTPTRIARAERAEELLGQLVLQPELIGPIRVILTHGKPKGATT